MSIVPNIFQGLPRSYLRSSESVIPGFERNSGTSRVTRKILTSVLVLVSCSISPVFALDEKMEATKEKETKSQVKISPGMMLWKRGDTSILIPKGGKLKREGTMVFIESDSEYSSRNFQEARRRFRKIEKKQRKMEKELAELKKKIKQHP